MNKSCYGLMLASSLVVAGNASAEEEKTEEEKSPWTSSLELGFVRTTGNTETQTTIGKFDIAYAAGNWKHTGHAEGYGQQSENDLGVSVVSAERYEIMGKSDYNFTDRDYAFGLIRLQKDLFSGFEYENVLSLGYGRKVILKDNMELDLEIGPGIKFFKVDNAAESQDEALLVLAANYWWAITDTSKFIQELRTDIGEDFTSSRSVTGIQANINKTLALRFTYTIRHKSEVPDPTTTEKMDTEAAMSLVYNF